MTAQHPTTLATTDPRTGVTRETGIEELTDAQVAELTTAAEAAFRELRRHPREWRAGLLRALADGLEARRTELVETAQAETGLATPRLEGELTRTVFQLRLFADAVLDGGYLEAVIDHAGDTPLGAAPDVRRMLVPIGPVAVFGASNFPFAFSVPGGDTASALAAGNPVVLKAHESHPLTSRLAFEAMRDAAAAYGAPDGTLGIVYGRAAGATLVTDPRIAAVGFTGSLGAGSRAARPRRGPRAPDPVLRRAQQPQPAHRDRRRPPRPAATPSPRACSPRSPARRGQLCTKPGIAFVPRSADALVAGLVSSRSRGGRPADAQCGDPRGLRSHPVAAGRAGTSARARGGTCRRRRLQR